MATRKREDDFSPATIRTLRERVNGICSNPDCRITTVGPQESTHDKSVIDGEAAHICAKAPGGPRYDPAMTSEQRRSIDNGIWLCRLCARKIDIDIERYPVSLLRSWKRESEKYAKLRFNKPLQGHNQTPD